MNARVSIPGRLRKTIQDLKTATGNHSDEEVYAMLKECAMDPNETAERLLLQDTFHEVKRKRDKRKENNKDSTDSRWRPGIQGRGGRNNRGNYSRYVANDAGGGRNVGAGKENGVTKGTEKGNASTAPPIVDDAETKSTVLEQGSPGTVVNGLSNVETATLYHGSISQAPGMNCIKNAEEISAAESNKTRTSIDTSTNSSSGQSFPGLMGSIKCEVETLFVDEKSTNKIVSCDDVDSKLSFIRSRESSELQNSYTLGKLQDKSPRIEGNQLLDAARDTSSTSINSSAGSRPSSNYSSRSQQLNFVQRGAGPNKEWKPKSSSANLVQNYGVPSSSNAISITVEAVNQSVSATSSTPSCIDMLLKKLEDLPFSSTEPVIIPNHLQVSESERSGLSFGSFDASFDLGTSLVNGTDNNKGTLPLSESSQDIEENDEEHPSSFQVPSPTTQRTAYSDNSQSPTQQSEILASKEPDVSSEVSTVQEFDQSKPEGHLAADGLQHSIVHTTPTYSSFSLAPQMLGSQASAFEGTENQQHENSRLPNFIVHQSLDPSSSYYTQLYRPPIEGDGRFSPFFAPAAAAKYTGNLATLPTQAGQSPQESGNSLVMSSTGPTPITTQAAGLMHSSLPVTQQVVPVFRQAAGVHISHYHPNYVPYNPYFSPLFIPPTTIHPLLSNTTFPQQPPTGGILTAPAAAASATTVKFTIPQFKPGANVGNATHGGMPTGFGAYNSTPAGFNPNPTGTSGNSTTNDDLTASQFKENTVYLSGQQSEGSAVWIPTPGRDIPTVQASSFYMLPPQGQHISFATPQPGPGAFTGIYHHPTQNVTAAAVHPLLPQSQPAAGSIEVVGPPPSVYQQPQRGPISWANNY